MVRSAVYLLVAVLVIATIGLIRYDLPNPSDLASRDLDQTAEGRVVFEHDFGLVHPGEKLRHVFEVSNTSGALWTVDTVKTSCACTVPSLGSQVIQPGQTETIEVALDTGKKPIDLVQLVVVTFKERSAPLVGLRVKALVRAPLTPVPETLKLGKVVEGSPATGSLMVHNYSGRDWKDATIQSSPSWLEWRISPLDSRANANEEFAPRQSWRLIATTRPDLLPRGVYRTEVVLASDDGQNLQGVPIDLQVHGPVAVTPSQLFFGRVTQDASPERSVSLSFFADPRSDEIQRSKITASLAHDLDFRWKEVAKNRWELWVQLSPGESVGLAHGTVEIQFHESNLPNVVIPVAVFCTSS
jgi:hypothetical protein